MMRRVSIHPFDLGGKLEKVPEHFLTENELERVVLQRDEQRWIGFPVHAFRCPKHHAELRISHEGFGLIICTVEHPEADFCDHEGIAEALIARHTHHKDSLTGKHPLCLLRTRILHSLAPKEGIRPNLLREFPYVLSFFAAEPESPLDLTNTRMAQGVCALVEPSHVTMSEADYVDLVGDRIKTEIASHIGEISDEFVRETLHDWDIHPDCHCFASWAGVVVVSPSSVCERQIRLVTALECRVQLAWVMAYFSQLWSRNILRGEPNVEDVDEIRWRIMPILRTVRSLIDASISTRHGNILTALKTTSGLERQIADAEQAFDDTEKYVRYKQRSRAQTYETYVEVALFVLALSQIIPLFFKTPIWEVPRLWIVGALVPTILLLLLRLRR